MLMGLAGSSELQALEQSPSQSGQLWGVTSKGLSTREHLCGSDFFRRAPLIQQFAESLHLAPASVSMSRLREWLLLRRTAAPFLPNCPANNLQLLKRITGAALC